MTVPRPEMSERDMLLSDIEASSGYDKTHWQWVVDLADFLLAAGWHHTRAQPVAAWRPTHQHRKGGLYQVVGGGFIEADKSHVVIYQDQDGTRWIRPWDEFYDGRFTILPEPPQ